MIKRVLSTELANELIKELSDIHGLLVFHQSGGCCDGSSPMCFPRSEFKVGSRDIYLGSICNQPFFISQDQEFMKITKLKNLIKTLHNLQLNLKISKD